MFDRLSEERRRVKAVVREANREAEDKFLQSVVKNFGRNVKMFWKEVMSVRK